MAMEVMQTAAVAYQGRTSNAAKPAKAKSSEAAVLSEAENARLPAESAKPTVKSAQPAESNVQEKEMLGDGSRQTTRQLQQAVEKLKKNMMAQTEAVFGIHEGTNRVMIKIVDKDTKDVIKEYPPEQTLDMIQKVWEMAGIMVDEKM